MTSTRKVSFIGLNAVRALSLISLILVFSSTIFVIVTNIKAVNYFDSQKNATDSASLLECDYIDGSTAPNQPAGPFWAVVASLLIIVQTIILFLSECGWPTPFFDRFFPVLGSNFGLGPLGIFQGLISTQILSHHVDDFTLVAAFFLFVLGCINMLLGLIFRESAKRYRSITTWREGAKTVLPATLEKRPMFLSSTPVISNPFAQPDHSFGGPQVTVVRHETSASETPSWTSTGKVGYGFGRQGEKAAGLKGFLLQKPEESLPRYVANSPAPTSSASLSRSVSSVSASSSFFSKDVRRVEEVPPMPPRFQLQDEHVTESRSATPTFKSSSRVV